MINISELSNKSHTLPPFIVKVPSRRKRTVIIREGEEREEIGNRRLPGDDLYLPYDVN